MELAEVSITTEGYWSPGSAAGHQEHLLYLALDTARCDQLTFTNKVVAVRVEAWASDQGWTDMGDPLNHSSSWTGADIRLMRKVSSADHKTVMAVSAFENLSGFNQGHQGLFQRHVAILGPSHAIVKQMIMPGDVISLWSHQVYPAWRCFLAAAKISIVYTKSR